MPLKLAVFDFDLTLSAVHLFHTLAGTLPVPYGHPFAPYALSERGQFARIIELEGVAYRACGGFSKVIMGGTERIAMLRRFLAELTAAGIECMICTRGLIGPVKKCLDLTGLLQYFSVVWGNIGDINGATSYDERLQLKLADADERLLGRDEVSLASHGCSKQKVVAHCLRERGLGPLDVVFLDDTLKEVRQLQGTCATIHVSPDLQPSRGLGASEMNQIRKLIVQRSLLGASILPMELLQLDEEKVYQQDANDGVVSSPGSPHAQVDPRILMDVCLNVSDATAKPQKNRVDKRQRRVVRHSEGTPIECCSRDRGCGMQ
jgi:hypothetical protein